MGKLIPLPLDILDELSEFAKNATKELYVDYSKWNFTKKLMLGVNLYVTNCTALLASYAGIENEFDWTWPNDFVLDNPLKTDLLNKEKIKHYIDRLEKFDGGHPLIKRLYRRATIQKKDPFYYYLQD